MKNFNKITKADLIKKIQQNEKNHQLNINKLQNNKILILCNWVINFILKFKTYLISIPLVLILAKYFSKYRLINKILRFTAWILSVVFGWSLVSFFGYVPWLEKLYLSIQLTFFGLREFIEGSFLYKYPIKFYNWIYYDILGHEREKVSSMKKIYRKTAEVQRGIESNTKEMEEFKQWYKEYLNNILNNKKKEESNLNSNLLLILIILAIISVGGYYLWDYLPGFPDWIKNISIPDWIKNLGILDSIKNKIGVPDFIKNKIGIPDSIKNNIGIPKFIKNRFKNKEQLQQEYNDEMVELSNDLVKFKHEFYDNPTDATKDQIASTYQFLVNKFKSFYFFIFKYLN